MDKLQQAIKDYKLLRTHGFPFIMPVLKSLEGQDYKEKADHLATLISNHVEQKYEKITTLTQIAAKKADWKKAFLSTVEHDFLKIGLTREQMALKWLKTRYKGILWDGDVDLPIEKQGIDITGNGFQLGISVKGFGFKGCPAAIPHFKKLKENNFKRTFVLYVDEIKSDFLMEEVI